MTGIQLTSSPRIIIEKFTRSKNFNVTYNLNFIKNVIRIIFNIKNSNLTSVNLLDGMCGYKKN